MKAKFEIGQIVHIKGPWEVNSRMGKIKGVSTHQEVRKIKNKNKVTTKICYLILIKGEGERNLEQEYLFKNINEVYIKTRNKTKSSAKSTLTRLKNILEKNEQKLIGLQKKLQSCK